MTDIVQVYDATKKRGWISVFSNSFGHIKEHKTLLVEMLKVSLFSEFRKSFIGYSWLILAPILHALSWLILDATNVLSPGKTEIPYGAYVILSSSIWAFFMSFYDRISKIYSTSGGVFFHNAIPREIIILEQIIICCFHFIIPFLVNLVFLSFVGVEFSWHIILFPLALIPLALISISVGLIMTLVNVVAVDLFKGFDYAFKMLIFITPVVYSEKVGSPFLQKMISYNPLTYLFCSARDLLIKGSLYQPQNFYLVTLGSVLLCIICLRLFLVSEKRIIERLIN